MKLKDLPEGTNILQVPIELTDELKEYYRNYGYPINGPIYLVGPTMGDWFISLKPSGKREIYPMPLEVEPSDFLECEIVN